MNETVDAAEVDEGAKSGDARHLAVAPLADDKAGERFTSTTLALLAGNIRCARPNDTAMLDLRHLWLVGARGL